jgi:hypothetical protein
MVQCQQDRNFQDPPCKQSPQIAKVRRSFPTCGPVTLTLLPPFPFLSPQLVLPMMPLYRELAVYDVPLNVFVIGFFLIFQIQFLLTSYLSLIDLVIPVQLICSKISPKILFTVFANASPSLLTYPISPAYCIPLLISVLWSLICLVK